MFSIWNFISNLSISSYKTTLKQIIFVSSPAMKRNIYHLRTSDKQCRGDGSTDTEVKGRLGLECAAMRGGEGMGL